jgi:glyoxylase-like metal-dependent hydrolase (beta-lactamase superfamily II)
LSQNNDLKAVIETVTPFQQNCSIIWCGTTRRGAIIDPGGEIERLIESAARRDITVEKILITHAHLDHAGGAAALAAHYGVPIEGPHRADQMLIDAIEQQGARYGMPECRHFTPDRWFEDGDTVTVGLQTFAIRHCPGHAPGHVVFVHEAARLAFIGDVLFHGSIGRTDLAGGDHDALIRSVVTKLWPFGDDITFVPGHGPVSSFGEERRTNPFVGDDVLAGTAG